MHIYVTDVYMSVDSWRCQRQQIALELLQAVMRCPTSVMETELGSSTRTGLTLDPLAISPAPRQIVLSCFIKITLHKTVFTSLKKENSVFECVYVCVYMPTKLNMQYVFYNRIIEVFLLLYYISKDIGY